MSKSKKTAEAVAEAIRLRLDGKSLEEVGAVFGVCASIIYQWTRKEMPAGFSGRTGRKGKPKSELTSERSGVVEEQNYSSCSHNFPGHNERYTGHMKRIRAYLRAHPEEVHGAALEKSTIKG